MSRPTEVLIFVPAGGAEVKAVTMQAVYEVGNTLTQRGISNSLCWFVGSDIEVIRNLIVTTWYDCKPHSSHLLCIDSDMGFNPQLVIDMLRFDKPLTGVLYAKRQQEFAAVGQLFEGHSSKDVRNGFLPAARLGAGVLLIKRQTITTMLDKMPHISRKLPKAVDSIIKGYEISRIIHAFDKLDDGEERLSEDISFCERWKQCGGEIWANIDHRISHVGLFDFHIRYAGILAQCEAEEATKTEKAKAA